jgi:hypothetical protein
MNNPNTDIRECLVITMIPWEGVLKCASIPYGYGDDGMPVWEEPQIGDEQDGLIPFIFETFREFCLRDGEVS